MKTDKAFNEFNILHHERRIIEATATSILASSAMTYRLYTVLNAYYGRNYIVLLNEYDGYTAVHQGDIARIRYECGDVSSSIKVQNSNPLVATLYQLREPR